MPITLGDLDARKDHVVPAGGWKFDEEVARVFDEMLRRSIPQYDVMRSACLELAKWFVRNKTDFLDLGSSRGDGVEELYRIKGAQLRWILVEKAPAMIAILKDRFKGPLANNTMSLREVDFCREFPECAPSVVQSILTIQFTPIEYRQAIVQNVHDRLERGGAFIFVEKILGSNAEIEAVMAERYLKLKADAGYSAEEIQRKRLSLEGVLVPVTAAWNEELLRQAGFRKIDCFWRWMNFAGWLAVKG